MEETGQLAFWRRLEEVLVAFPEKLLWGDFRYRDLDRVLDSTGRRLCALGLADRDRAAVICRNPFLGLVLGTVMAWQGVIPVPVNPEGAEIFRLLEEARVSGIFAEKQVYEGLPRSLTDRLPCYGIDAGLTLPRLNGDRIPVTGTGDAGILAIFPESGEQVPFEAVLRAGDDGGFLTDLPIWEPRGFVGLLGHLLRGSTLYFGGSGELPRVRPGAAALSAGDSAALAAQLRRLADSRWELALLRAVIRKGGYAPAGRLRKLTAPVLGGNLRAIGGESRENRDFFREMGLSWLELGENSPDNPDNKIM